MIPRPPRSTLFPYTTLFRAVRTKSLKPMRRRYRSNNSSPAYEVSFASVNSSGRFLLTRACNSVFLRLTVDGLSFVVGGLGGTSLSTTTKGLFQFAARSSARKNCRIRVNKRSANGTTAKRGRTFARCNTAPAVRFATRCSEIMKEPRRGGERGDAEEF